MVLVFLVKIVNKCNTQNTIEQWKGPESEHQFLKFHEQGNKLALSVFLFGRVSLTTTGDFQRDSNFEPNFCLPDNCNVYIALPAKF